MVDTITLGITQRAWDRDTHLWSREDFRKGKGGCRKASSCLLNWRRLQGGVRYSITGSVGTAINGHNRDVLTHAQVEFGLSALLNTFNQCFTTSVGLEDLEVSRIDFFTHVSVADPDFTIRSVKNSLPSTKRDWCKLISSDSETVLRKSGARVECYYAKYHPSIEGDIPRGFKREDKEMELPFGIVRSEVRLKRLAFRAQGLRQLDKGIDVLQFLERGYAELMLPPTELVQAHARPINEFALLEKLAELYGRKCGYDLWCVARDIERYGVDELRKRSGREPRTIRVQLARIQQAALLINENLASQLSFR